MASKRAQQKKDKLVTCPICEDLIEDATNKNKGHDSIYCEGNCGAWLHRGCAGLSKGAFAMATKSTEPFHFSHCQINIQAREISALKYAIDSLSSDLAAIKSLMDTFSKPSESSPVSASASVSKSNPAPNKVSGTTQPNNSYVTAKPGMYTLAPTSERKLNLVVFGLKESPQGTLRHSRFSKDLDDVSSIFSSLLSSFNDLTIRDCFRLGRYSNTRIRPLMVKLNSVNDALSILSSRSKLSSFPNIFIKPDRSPEERVADILAHVQSAFSFCGACV